MKQVFDSVYQFLKWISINTGLSYHEVNIIVYYILIPAIFILLIDRLYKTYHLKIGFAIIVFLGVILIPDFEKFSTQLFTASVAFLNWFDSIGLNYVQASVIICVIVPVIIFSVLIYFGKKPTHKRKS